MSKREDIIDAKEIYLADGSIRKYGLIYTNKCGWVDLGHANPASAKKLWDDIRQATMFKKTIPNIDDGSFLHKVGKYLSTPDTYVYISYSQTMRNRGIEAGIYRHYRVKKNLLPDEQKSVALAIFMDVSLAFEGLQSNWVYRHLTDSGYSVEDLVSDLIGFYRAIYPSIDYIKLCEPVSKKQALSIWDTFGAVGSTKNEQFAPVLYPNPLIECGILRVGKLPPELDTIRPAIMGDKFYRN